VSGTAAVLLEADGVTSADILARPANLFQQFASLGVNCEFGFVQRHFGSEPLDLLRFAGVQLDALMQALACDFEGLGDPRYLRFERWDREYVVFDSRFGFHTHTGISPDEMPAERFRQRASGSWRFLVRKFREDAGGERILVRTARQPVAPERIRELHRALQRYGPAVLLHITEAHDGKAAGTVEWLDDGLMLASISRLGDPVDRDWRANLAYTDWLAICRRAFALHDEAKRTTRAARRRPDTEAVADPARLLCEFASLGESSEFGLAQRHFGAEPLGLLRFATIGYAELMAALAADFAGLGDPSQTELLVTPRDEYVIVDTRYGLRTPTGTKSASVDRDWFFAAACRRQRFLAARFREDAGGERIMVRADHAPIAMEQIRELHGALQCYGAATLLHVGTASEPVNTIERLDNGLLVAGVWPVRRRPDGGWNIDADVWLALCRQAFAMHTRDERRSW
jgi:hypothetical protein